MTPAPSRRARAAQNSLPSPRPSGPVRLALIAAVAANGVIGERNRLPWRLPEDLRRFRALTTGHAVIMGRKTWESLPGPLPGRQCIVVTRNPDYRAAGAEVAATLEAALALVQLPPPAFCIGGGELYRVAFPLADLLYLTEIGRDFSGDATFPAYDRGAWREVSREPHQGEGPDAFPYSFVARERRGA
jgi:dihydrofolate reductase